MLIAAKRLVSVVQPVILTTTLGITAAYAQSDEALDTLVFDPVLIRDEAPLLAAGNLAQVRIGRLVDPGFGDVVFTDASGADMAESTNAIDAYQQAITRLERQDGQYAADLVEQLLPLARLYQQQGQHELAIAAFERADHISRVNNGLYHAQQFPIIEGQVESYLALGDFAAVNDRQKYLQYLSRKLGNAGTPARAPSLAGLGDQNMYTFGLALMERDDPNGPGRLFFGGGDVPTASEISRIHAVNSLYRAKDHYADAISRMIEDRDYRTPRLLELEYKLLETLFLTGFSDEFIDNPHYYITSARSTANMPNRWKHLRRNREGYEAGVDIFERILTYMENDAAVSPEDKVRAHLEYADWHLVFAWNDAAISEYGNAWQLAQSLALDNDAMKTLFSPDYPMQLPLFTPKPNSREKFGISRETDLAYDGWIDMRFTINSNGTARNIQLVDQSESTTFGTAARLRRYLKNSPFRPRIADGDTVSREDVTMRYYYAFQ